MSDLEEYDRKIVEAAEYFQSEMASRSSHGLAGIKVWDAVQAKREARRLCDWCAVAPSPAVQKVQDPWLKETAFRCAEHKMEVTEL